MAARSLDVRRRASGRVSGHPTRPSAGGTSADAPWHAVRLPDAADLVPGFSPETDLERAVSEDPELLAGLAWGEPREGHPEGSVGAHVGDLLAAVEGGGHDAE